MMNRIFVLYSGVAFDARSSAASFLRSRRAMSGWHIADETAPVPDPLQCRIHARRPASLSFGPSASVR